MFAETEESAMFRNIKIVLLHWSVFGRQRNSKSSYKLAKVIPSGIWIFSQGFLKNIFLVHCMFLEINSIMLSVWFFISFFFEQKRGHHRFLFLILTIGSRLCYGNTFNVSGRIRALLGGSRTNCEPFHSQDLISNSPDCLLKNRVILVLRIWYWTNQWSSTDVFLYSRLKNDKILKEAYWSVERFKNDLWKLNIVPLELSFSPEVFAVAVMLWRLKCQGCIRDLVILETPAVVKVESLSEISPERMFVLGDRKISMKMVIRCHWIVKQVDHEKNKRRIILFRKDFPTRKNWDQCKESWALWLRMNAKNQRRNISFSSEEFKSIEVLLKVNPFK